LQLATGNQQCATATNGNCWSVAWFGLVWLGLGIGSRVTGWLTMKHLPNGWPLIVSSGHAKGHLWSAGTGAASSDAPQ